MVPLKPVLLHDLGCFVVSRIRACRCPFYTIQCCQHYCIAEQHNHLTRHYCMLIIISRFACLLLLLTELLSSTTTAALLSVPRPSHMVPDSLCMYVCNWMASQHTVASPCLAALHASSLVPLLLLAIICFLLFLLACTI